MTDIKLHNCGHLSNNTIKLALAAGPLTVAPDSNLLPMAVIKLKDCEMQSANLAKQNTRNIDPFATEYFNENGDNQHILSTQA